VGARGPRPRRRDRPHRQRQRGHGPVGLVPDRAHDHRPLHVHLLQRRPAQRDRLRRTAR
jgi:hypothetical protein